MRAYLLADEHGNGRYALASLYYDSPDFRCYWEKVDGIRFRRKLRIRRYESPGAPLTEDTPVFVEIKQRVDRVTQKRRVILPYGEALRLCNKRQYSGSRLRRRMKRWWMKSTPISGSTTCVPSASCVMSVRRSSAPSTISACASRLIFSLSYQVHQLRLDEEASSLPMISPDRVVMEIKVNERIPYWLTEMIAAHNLKMIRISKYCRSIELRKRAR
ncbi:MAG: VTC domain-containing protein [Anaerolineales bacterium]|nr:VTC domain-containing protein [Anaerolineales bacterium]